VIDCVVAPVDHRYEEAALDVSVMSAPVQNEVAPDGVIVGVVAGGFSMTVVAALVAVQPLASVTATV
jgi:hypothetical protein